MFKYFVFEIGFGGTVSTAFPCRRYDDTVQRQEIFDPGPHMTSMTTLKRYREIFVSVKNVCSRIFFQLFIEFYT